MKDFTNKIILITGASSGIGQELAIEFAKEKVQLILIGRKEDKLIETKKNCLNYTKEVHYFVGNIGHWDIVKKIGTEIKIKIGIPDILINNAGEGKFLNIDECQSSEIEDSFKAPFFAAFYWVQFFITEFKQKNNCLIVNINAPAAYFPFPNTITYSTCRSAFRSFSRCLRLDLKNTFIKIIEVVPGLTASNYFSNNQMDWNTRIPYLNQFFFKPLQTNIVAKSVIRGIKKNKKLICPQPLMYFFIFCSNIFPSIFDRLMQIKSK